jgi:hypothetical protein
MTTLTIDDAQLVLNDHIGQTVEVEVLRESQMECGGAALRVSGELCSAATEYLSTVGAHPDEADLGAVYRVGDCILDFASEATGDVRIERGDDALLVWFSDDVGLAVLWGHGV